jgi:N,N'-diacetyllegionaminate synthase
MIRQAKLAGADIAKFQLDRMPGRDDPIRNAPNEWIEFLNESCQFFDIEFMASIWSHKALDMARSVGMKRYKIAHQMRDFNIIKDMLMDKKNTYISGRIPASFILPDYAFSIFTQEKYPEYHVELPDHFGRCCWYGYSDHSCGIEACLLAVSRGAQYIEKHFTLDKTEASIKDNHFSADPKEFEELTRIGRAIGRING